MEAFHADFPSYEKQVEKELKNKKVEEDLVRKNMFEQMYPNVNWNNLEIQGNNIFTRDGCIHYKDKLTNNIYSWYFNRTWMQHSKEYQLGLLRLFNR